MAKKSLRRSDTVEITRQKAKGRVWFKLKTLILRLVGFGIIFVPMIPITQIAGIVLITYTFIKKDKHKLKYKVLCMCPVCNGEQYFSTDVDDGIIDKKCDECSTNLKVNLERLTVTEKYRGNVNLHQKEMMNYEVNKDVNMEELRVSSDEWDEREEEKNEQKRLAREELKFQRKKELKDVELEIHKAKKNI